LFSLCSFYFCFLLFSYLKSNRVSILLCRIVHADTDRCSSRWGMIQELWLLLEETEMRQHLTINIDTKPHRVLQTGGVYLRYDVLHTPLTTRLGWVNFLVRLLIRQTFSSYYLDTCKFRNINVKDAFRKNRNAGFLGFEFERDIQQNSKYQREFPGEVSTCFEYVVFETAFCYSVSEDRMECWCRISSGLKLRTFVCRRGNSCSFGYLLYS
jgi:hypothetical protein